MIRLYIQSKGFFVDRRSGNTGVHRKIHQVVGNVEARRAGVPDVVKVPLATGEWTGVDRLSLGQKDQAVEQGNNVGAWLVDGKYHSAVVGLGQCDETLHNIKCIESILD